MYIKKLKGTNNVIMVTFTTDNLADYLFPLGWKCRFTPSVKQCKITLSMAISMHTTWMKEDVINAGSLGVIQKFFVF